MQIVNWYLSLPGYGKVAVSIMLFFLLLTLIVWVCAIVFKFMDGKPRLTVIPTEEELKKREEENAKRAFIKFTKRIK